LARRQAGTAAGAGPRMERATSGRRVRAAPLAPGSTSTTGVLLLEPMGPRVGVAMFDAVQGPLHCPGPAAPIANDWQDPAADEVRRAWEAMPTSLFGSEEARGRAFDVFGRLGLVGALVGARRGGQSVDAFAALALSKAEVRAVKGHRAIVHAWIAPLRRPAQGVPPPRQSASRLAARPAED